MVRVQLGSEIATLTREQYVIAALAGESSVFRSPEALKAMAVAARTYAVRMQGRHSREGFDFCSTTHCQRLDPKAITERLANAADATAGEVLWIEGRPAFTPYTRDCGGRTEDAGAVWPDLSAPYLKSHPDEFCVRTAAGPRQWHGELSAQDLQRALRAAGLRFPATIERITIANRTAAERIRELDLLGAGQAIRINAGSLRFAIGRSFGWNRVQSETYVISRQGDAFVFDGRGSGHGVGLCQLGAERMGLEQHDYHEILSYYYPGTVAGITARGLRWQAVSSDRIRLYSIQPGQDASILAEAERQSQWAAERLGLPSPKDLEIRVYPDVATFRAATGEPGWVAAHTSGTRISLQPGSVLQRSNALKPVLRHEIVHAVLESQARPGLPVWFREGLTEYLAGSGVARPIANSVDDPAIRQREDVAKARQAYAGASARVTELVKSYGEGTVLGWLKRGLPRDVTDASSSQAHKNNK
jgi:stage II sporulation protein D